METLSFIASIVSVAVGGIAIFITVWFYFIGKKEHEDFGKALSGIKLYNKNLITMSILLFATIKGIKPEEGREEIVNFIKMQKKEDKKKYLDSLNPLARYVVESTANLNDMMKKFLSASWAVSGQKNDDDDDIILGDEK
ncbi:MAG: hypothetical protein JXD23_08045 [Spirochaetales bacterium]|nr:hypothetical protein [Spirochaetales bacterium]